MSLNIPDEACQKIFTYLFLRHWNNEQPIRFNDLYRHLNKTGFKISRPTLSNHLKHLVENDLIVRDEINIQHTTYRFNHEKFFMLEDYHADTQEWKKFLREERDTFDSKPIEEQVRFVFVSLVIRELAKLREDIYQIKEPNKHFEHHLTILLMDSIWEGVKRYLLESCVERGENYQNEIIQSLNKLIEDFTPSIS